MGRAANTPETLWSKVDVREEDECWPWLGFRNDQGYGRTWINDKGYYAHRVIFNLASPGVITLAAPKDRRASGFLLHSCDNPACCNPNHLSVGTHTDNMKDKRIRGRSPNMRGVNSPLAKLTGEQVNEIRWLAACNLSSGEIAAAFGVSKPSVKTLRAGRSYVEAA